MGLNKRGSEMTLSVVLFIILNIMVFTSVIIFVERSSNNILSYEEIYAKKISLILDSSEYDSEFYLDVTEGVNVAKKNGANISHLKLNSFQFIPERNSIKVSLGKGISGGYEFAFFKEVDLDLTLNIDNTGKAILIITKKEKQVGVKDE